MLIGAICVVTGSIVAFRGISSDWSPDLVRSSIALGTVFGLAGIYAQFGLSTNPLILGGIVALFAVSLFYLVRADRYPLRLAELIGFSR